jgi:hypothetical protein
VEAREVRLADRCWAPLPEQDDEGHSALLPPSRRLDEAWPGRTEEEGEQASQEVSPCRSTSGNTAGGSHHKRTKSSGGARTGRAAQRDEATTRRFAQVSTDRTGHVPSECLAA